MRTAAHHPNAEVGHGAHDVPALRKALHAKAYQVPPMRITTKGVGSPTTYTKLHTQVPATLANLATCELLAESARAGEVGLWIHQLAAALNITSGLPQSAPNIRTWGREWSSISMYSGLAVCTQLSAGRGAGRSNGRLLCQHTGLHGF
jgi:hypothetical protein